MFEMKYKFIVPGYSGAFYDMLRYYLNRNECLYLKQVSELYDFELQEIRISLSTIGVLKDIYRKCNSDNFNGEGNHHIYNRVLSKMKQLIDSFDLISDYENSQ